MRIILQSCLNASVEVEKRVVGKINKGYVLLVGFTHDDTNEIIEKMAEKVINLRIFEDNNDKMNLSLNDVGGEILSISQFTLYGKLNGRRPSFSDAMKYEEAKEAYEYFNEVLKRNNIKVETGIFGENMKVSLINDGPKTIIMDSKECL